MDAGLSRRKISLMCATRSPPGCRDYEETMGKTELGQMR